MRFLEPTGALWKRSVKRLPRHFLAELAAAIDELAAGDVPKGRNLEKLRGYEDLYSVRLNRTTRFAYRQIDEDTAVPIAVGSHDYVYRSLRRRGV